MKYQHIGYRIQGFYKMANLSNKWEAIMGTHAQQKLDALEFCDKHGLNATLDAFKVSRATLYRWRKLYEECGISALHDGDRSPRHRRRRNWDKCIIDEIRRLRHSYPNLGAEKVYCFLKPWCNDKRLPCPKPRTIARLIADATDNMRCSPPPNARKTRKTKASSKRERLEKDYKDLFPGNCVAMDTIHYFINGIRYYLFTAIDLHSRFAIAIACRRANSKTAAAFAKLVMKVFPATIKQVLTDNGSEFAGDFHAYLQKCNIRHCYTYPRCPKMNAVDERFNRTIQEEFVAYHEDLLGEDLTLFNDVLFEYLMRYNCRRPHHSLGLQTPVQRFASSQPDLSHMLWHHTNCFDNPNSML